MIKIRPDAHAALWAPCTTVHPNMGLRMDVLFGYSVPLAQYTVRVASRRAFYRKSKGWRRHVRRMKMEANRG